MEKAMQGRQQLSSMVSRMAYLCHYELNIAYVQASFSSCASMKVNHVPAAKRNNQDLLVPITSTRNEIETT